MINQGRATHYPTLTVKFTGRYRAADRLGQPSQAVDASSANQSALANCETRETQCQLLERVIDIPRTCSRSCASSTQRCLRRRAERRPARTRPDMSRRWTMALCTDRKCREKFGTAEARRGIEKSAIGCRTSAARNESVWRSVTAKVFGLGQKADLRQSRSCSDRSSCRAGCIGSGGACALTRDQSVASAAHALYQRSRANRAGQ
jgi:hypothetical protein